MKVVILAGGLGTRLQEETVIRPKPLVEVGGRPILWHIMKIYSNYGFNEFIIALGYKGDLIKQFFLNYYYLQSDITVDLGSGNVKVPETRHENWVVHLVDTGIQTQTGGRIKRLARLLGDEPFMLTYGDGVADINVPRLVAFHQDCGKACTVTAVRPPSRFGGLTLDDQLVRRFDEKPQIGEGWINGGFFVLEPQVLDYISDDNSIFERDPLESLASTGQMAAYRHEGFWHGMDTLRDLRHLDELWQSGSPPWKAWP